MLKITVPGTTKCSDHLRSVVSDIACLEAESCMHIVASLNAQILFLVLEFLATLIFLRLLLLMTCWLRLGKIYVSQLLLYTKLLNGAPKSSWFDFFACSRGLGGYIRHCPLYITD